MRYLTKLATGIAATLLCLTAQAQTLVVGDQSYNAQAVMEAAGVLNDLPYTLEWKQFTAGSPVAEALNANSLDIGLLGDAPVLFLGALGAPIKVIAVTRQNLEGVAILVKKDSSIHSLADLKGKRAAVWKGSWSQQLLFTALDNAGVPRDSLELRYLSALDASHALEGGSVDVIATWEPYVTQQERQGARGVGNRRGFDSGPELHRRQREGRGRQARTDQRFSPTLEESPRVDCPKPRQHRRLRGCVGQAHPG